MLLCDMVIVLRRLCPHDDEGQCVPPTESYGKTIKSGTEREVFLAKGGISVEKKV